MSTFNILNRHSASFELEEYNDDEEYTKRVSVCFDGLNEYRIKSQRKDEIMSVSKRVDIVLLP